MNKNFEAFRKEMNALLDRFQETIGLNNSELVADAVEPAIKEKSGQIEGFVTEAQEATTGGLVETSQSEKSRIMKKIKAVGTHLLNAVQQRSTGIPAKDELNINNTSEEAPVEPVPVEAPVEPVPLDAAPVEAVPAETPRVEEVDEPVIQSSPDVVSTGETAPIQETQEGQPLPGADEDVPEQEIKESQNLPAAGLNNNPASDALNNMFDEATNVKQQEVPEQVGKTLVMNAVTNGNSNIPHV